MFALLARARLGSSKAIGGKCEGSFTSRNVVDGDWKFRKLEQKFRNLYLKLQKYINIFDIFIEYFRLFIMWAIAGWIR